MHIPHTHTPHTTGSLPLVRPVGAPSGSLVTHGTHAVGTDPLDVSGLKVLTRERVPTTTRHTACPRCVRACVPVCVCLCVCVCVCVPVGGWVCQCVCVPGVPECLYFTLQHNVYN